MESYLAICSMFRANCLFVRVLEGSQENLSHPSIQEPTPRTLTASDADDYGQGQGLFLLASFMNHSCHPTVEICRTSSYLTQFKAKVPLSPGEELTIDYLSLDPSLGPLAWDIDSSDIKRNEELLFDIVERFIERQSLMRDAYSTFCACRLCKRDLALSHYVQRDR